MFAVYLNDRERISGGDVLIAVVDSIDSFIGIVVSELGIICICFFVCCKTFILICCRRSSSANPSFVNKFYDVINNIIFRFSSIRLVIMGDFNFSNIVWCGACSFFEPPSSE